MLNKPRTGISLVNNGTARMFMIHALLEFGERQLAEGLAEELKEIAKRSSQINLVGLSLAVEGVFANLEGRLEEALEIGIQARKACEEKGLGILGIVLDLLVSGRVRDYLGRAEEIITLAAPLEPEKQPMYFAFLALSGRTTETRALLDQYLETWGSDSELYGHLPVHVGHINILEAAILVEHRPAVEWLLPQFAKLTTSTTGTYWTTCIPRQLGAASAFLGKYDEARQYYNKAIKVCAEMPFRPELAISRLQLAELLLEHYPDEKKEALEHLDFAIKEFREMKMQPSLERALRHKDILKA